MANQSVAYEEALPYPPCRQLLVPKSGCRGILVRNDMHDLTHAPICQTFVEPDVMLGSAWANPPASSHA